MNVKDKKTRIVVIGGGTGVFTVLIGLKDFFSNLTAIISMADDGGSTGVLREDFGILPPGDVRRALIALAKTDNKALSDLFNYRFTEGGGLAGHSFGNLMITALERLTGSFERAIFEASQILSAQGDIIPVTLRQAKLCAKLENNQIIKGETNIDIPRHDGNLKIKKVWLDPPVSINQRARAAIMRASMVIIGPGDLYTSILPNILVRGMTAALKKTKAKVVYFTNLMTKYGETNNFRASDFLSIMEKYLGKNVIDYVIVNSKKPAGKQLRPYAAEKSSLVEFDRENFGAKPTLIAVNLIRPRGFIRHDPQKTAKIIQKLI
jgi:uncharacterized cofD-like protein